jgi:ABC-2 type transport system ATP-binding protein
VIEAEHLVKRYGPKLAVDDVSFSIPRGKIAGFVGPNGAGKTTTLRIVAGFLGMTSGRVTLAGHDVEADPLRAKRALGYMPETVPLYPEMRVGEYLAFRAELKGVARGARAEATLRAARKAGVHEVLGQRIGTLSRGYRQRTGLADALVADPPILVLDEPTAGLDPNQIREVRDLVRALGESHTVLLSTHILSEVEATCDVILVLAGGKLVAQGTQGEIARKRRSFAVDFAIRGDPEKAEALLAAREGVARVRRRGAVDAVYTFRCTWQRTLSDEDVALATEASARALVLAGLHVRAVARTTTSLEEVFGDLTRAGEDSAGAPEA